MAYALNQLSTEGDYPVKAYPVKVLSFLLHTMFFVSLMCHSWRSKKFESLATTFVVSLTARNNLDEVMEQIKAFGFYRGCMLKLALSMVKKNHCTAML